MTTYFEDQIIARAGLATLQEHLAALSSHIGQLQNSRGRLMQWLEDASLDVCGSGTSGVGRDAATKLSYYVKGPVVGFLLDARIRRATDGKSSLDDVMRLAYRRYAGERGFTPEQFRATAEEVAGVPLDEWYRKAVASTDELDYGEALDWFGLRFVPNDDSKKAWKLEAREDASPAQKEHFRVWVSSGAPRNLE